MRLEKVTVHRCALPLVRPFRTSFSTDYTKEVLLLEVTTDVGVGWGECVADAAPLCSHEFNDAALLVLRDHLLPRLVGRDVTAEEVPDLLRPVRGHPMARGALELALLDAQLRSTGESFASYLGSVHSNIPCGVSTGIPADDSIDTLVAEVDGYVAEGYLRVKLKIQPGWDIEPTRVIRERYPDIPLQVDANQAYSRDDIDHLCTLDELDLLLVEQPIHEEDYRGHKQLAERMRTPVCLDESVLSADNAESLIDYGACEIVNIKAGRVGGGTVALADRTVEAMTRSAFAGFRFPPKVILLAVRWYLRYGLLYRDVVELLAERGVEVDHVTVYRWVQRFTPLLIGAARPSRHCTGDRWFVDETYVKVNGRWKYVYRAVDQFGQVIDVLVSDRRDTTAARRFFTTCLSAGGSPREVTTDRAPTLARAIDELIPGALHDTEQYANNTIECDHGRLKARLRPMRGIKTKRTANTLIRGHAFIQNLRRGHYELGTETTTRLTIQAAFEELATAI